jgi:hypothetical protein
VFINVRHRLFQFFIGLTGLILVCSKKQCRLPHGNIHCLRVTVCTGERAMMHTVSNIGLWLAAAGLALALAFASPSDSSVMGHLPSFMSQTLAKRPMTVPDDLPAERTLALITFKRTQKEHADSWVQGLNLKNDPSIPWIRMPVVNDPGTPEGRDEVQNRLLGRYTAEDERANLLPVFVDHKSFVRSAGLSGVDQAVAVVVNRRGEVLARVEGAFDETKAANLRETLRTRGYWWGGFTSPVRLPPRD